MERIEEVGETAPPPSPYRRKVSLEGGAAAPGPGRRPSPAAPRALAVRQRKLSFPTSSPSLSAYPQVERISNKRLLKN